MTSSRPYIIRALYEWIVNNNVTPYILVDATCEDVSVPEEFIEDGKIVLNIAPQAVGDLKMTNTAVEFDARFSSIARHVYVPIRAVSAIYAFENGKGMFFSEDDLGDDEPPEEAGDSKSKPALKIVE